MIFNIYKLNFNFTTAFQLLMVLTGLFITDYLIYKIIQNKITKNKQFRIFIIQGIVPLIIAVIYIMLFFTWTNHGGCLCIPFRALKRRVLSCVTQTVYVFMNSFFIRFFYGIFITINVILRPYNEMEMDKFLLNSSYKKGNSKWTLLLIQSRGSIQPILLW